MMISNRCYRIPPFSVKPEITWVEIGKITLSCQVVDILPWAKAHVKKILKKS
jgi:hypothetical protein